MTWAEAPTEEVDGLWGGTLPFESCSACGALIKRRQQRVYVRATWRGAREVLCANCWLKICTWASRFTMEQIELPF